ncbi:MAG: phosphoglycerate kinase [Clostridiales bacterium]|nr:phosphoglycerate kinase [Clostridiales bacterium]
MKKNINDFNFFEKKVLLRLDLNVPIKDGVIESTKRIDEAIPTLKALIHKNARVVVVSHLGKPDGKVVESLSLKPVFDYIKEKLPTKVYFSNEIANDKMNEEVENLKNGEVLILENIRYFKEEETCDEEFSKRLAKPFDIFILDAFGTAHRKHASTYGVSKYLESGIGMLVEKELGYLDDIFETSKHPIVAVLGGAKVKDKLKVIDNLLDKVDVLIIGGGMAFTFIKAMKGEVGKSIVDDDQLEYCYLMIKKAINNKVQLLLPIDSICAESIDSEIVKYYNFTKMDKNFMGLDIGHKTIKLFKKQIKKAKTIIINGPMGVFEKDKFSVGTKEILKAIVNNKKAIKVAGGGDTIHAIEKYNLEYGFSHLSTGGGASLKLLEGNGLVAINQIKNKGEN